MSRPAPIERNTFPGTLLAFSATAFTATAFTERGWLADDRVVVGDADRGSGARRAGAAELPVEGG
jgi:hypothetical protein